MQITEDHVEWAVVDRLGQMQDGHSDEHCRVTNSLALFLTTVLWVKQRVGAYPSRDVWPAGLAPLNEHIHSPHWGLRRGRQEGFANIRLHFTTEHSQVDLTNCSMWELIVWIRHVLAHGDARNIRPFHAMALEPRRRLIGFQFFNTDGHVSMTGSEMRFVGSRIASVFRDAYRDQFVHEDEVRNSVVEVVNQND